MKDRVPRSSRKGFDNVSKATVMMVSGEEPNTYLIRCRDVQDSAQAKRIMLRRLKTKGVKKLGIVGGIFVGKEAYWKGIVLNV